MCPKCVRTGAGPDPGVESFSAALEAGLLAARRRAIARDVKMLVLPPKRESQDSSPVLPLLLIRRNVGLARAFQAPAAAWRASVDPRHDRVASTPPPRTAGCTTDTPGGGRRARQRSADAARQNSLEAEETA